jgi:hypothetical protein
MIIRNADYSDICNAALDAGVLLECTNATRGKGYRVRLKLAHTKQYQRLGFTGRRIAAVCWHGHRAYFEALYRRAPLATVSTAQAVYHNAADFDATHDDTGYKNIGSQVDPLSYRAACLCTWQA